MSRSKLAILIGALAIIVAFLPIRGGAARKELKRIAAAVQSAEMPLQHYEAVPVEVLAAAVPAFQAIDTKGAPGEVAQALQDYISAMNECVRLMREGDSAEARQASRAVEAARVRIHSKISEARGLPY